MIEVKAGEKDAGGRLDKYLFRLLPGAGTGFLYKMLRKKNILLNGKKAEGKELIRPGDVICFYFSEETYALFRGSGRAGETGRPEAFPDIPVLGETEDILFLNKPAGVLSQKAKPEDYSLCEYLKEKYGTGEAVLPFSPVPAHRLDRNTSGIVACGKNLRGQRLLSDAFRKKEVLKDYLAIVRGDVSGLLPETGKKTISGFWKKDGENNLADFSPEKRPGDEEVSIALSIPDRREMPGVFLRTIPRDNPFFVGEDELSLVCVRLFTGKSHLIRVVLAFLGHPLAGDPKYGDRALNRRLGPLGIKRQLLHGAKLEFTGELSGIGAEAALPGDFLRLLNRQRQPSRKPEDEA